MRIIALLSPLIDCQLSIVMTIVNRQSPIAAAIQLTWPARWGANSAVNLAIYPLDFSVCKWQMLAGILEFFLFSQFGNTVSKVIICQLSITRDERVTTSQAQTSAIVIHLSIDNISHAPLQLELP